MTAYNQQPTPPTGAFQQDLDLLNNSIRSIDRTNGVVGPNGRGHTPLDASLAHAIANRGQDLSVLHGRPQVQGFER